MNQGYALGAMIGLTIGDAMGSLEDYCANYSLSV
jgi:hypothetical protein